MITEKVKNASAAAAVKILHGTSFSTLFLYSGNWLEKHEGRANAVVPGHMRIVPLTLPVFEF
jgi:hypothetical protein